jgi:8-oxo-dGTP pyrophosphatase MutT (NUDIX family)
MNGFEVLRRALDGDGTNAGDTGAARASVCVLVAGADRAAGVCPVVCLIRRAKWADDPWSEHIALPGGSRRGDETPAETVRREVREEVGISIGDAEELTALPQLRIRLAGRERTLLLDSFVCHVAGPAPVLQCSPEIHSAFWVPVADLWNAANLDYLALRDQGDTLVYPAVRLPQGTVFGITLRVLTLLSDRLGVPLRYLEEIPGLRRGGVISR